MQRYTHLILRFSISGVLIIILFTTCRANHEAAFNAISTDSTYGNTREVIVPK